MEYVLETDALTKRYRKFTALNGLSMHVPKGSIYGFIGRNGAGKTTLIRLICGLQEPTDGSFELYGAQNGAKEIYKARRRIGALVETPAIYRDMTAKENLKQQYRVLGLPSFDKIEELLTLVGLSDSDKKKAGRFSLGMRQRLGIAQAIMEDPEILILDEPFNGLDQSGIEEIHQLFEELRKKGKTILLASHSAADISRACDCVFEIEDGILQEKSGES